MSDRHEWTDDKLGCAFEATVSPGERLAITALFDRKREPRVSQDNEGWSIPHYFVREFFRLAARVKELHEAHLVNREEMSAIEDALPALPEADQGLPLADRVRLAILYAQAGNEYGVPLLEARVKELEGILADRGRVLFLHGPAETHEEQAVRAMRAHGHREALIAPLLPLFRERFEAWERVQGRGITGSPEFPKTITLTAEFPVEALRALTKE